MRVIAIEEHFGTVEILGDRAREANPIVEQLLDLGEGRLASMDAAGIDVQVLSTGPPGVQELDAAEAVPLARKTHDRLAEVIAATPERFAGFATLPTPDPQAAAAELERAVNELGFKGAMIHGHTRGRFLDEKDFWPIFETAEALAVPIYLHPTPPPQAVVDAYYSGLEPEVGRALATSAWGWHVETGMHALRLVVGGVFDQFPGLQVVIGHMGENIPFSVARADAILGRSTGYLKRRVSEYFQQNFHYTTSGYFTPAPLLCTLLVFGADRIIFSVDYPYSENAAGRAFLDAAPISEHDREKIAHGNVERLLRLGAAPAGGA